MYPPRRRPLALVLLLAGGCVPSLDPAFDRAARGPVDPARPIVGAWQGRWAAEDNSAAGPARVVVAAGAATESDRFEMELTGFPWADPGRVFTAEAVIDPRDAPVRDCDATVPAVVVDGGLCAAALGLQAHVDGDRLRVDYWVNDALGQVDAGHVELRRATPRPGVAAADGGRE